MLNKLKNKPIVINTDLDGMISGLLLKKYLGCEIVGFSNSAEKIWLQTDFSDFKNVCFVDMFVANPDIICIDQHIISVDKKHHQILKNNPNKINPNLLNSRFFLPDNSYYYKYPFGTVHFIIALLEKKGFDLSGINLLKKLHNITLIDLILRADDTMKTTIDSEYVNNATQWWNWLLNLSNNGKIILKLKEYLNNISVTSSKNIKNNISEVLKNRPFFCDSSDGGIMQPIKNKLLKDNVKTYFKFIAEIMAIEIEMTNTTYKTYKGYTKRLSLTKEFRNELTEFNTIKNKKIFSYAFVRSSKRDYNFSATFYQKND